MTLKGFFYFDFVDCIDNIEEKGRVLYIFNEEMYVDLFLNQVIEELQLLYITQVWFFFYIFNDLEPFLFVVERYGTPFLLKD